MRASIWVQVRGTGGRYDGRELRAGELVRMPPEAAALAHRLGWISLTRPAAAAIAAAIAAEGAEGASAPPAFAAAAAPPPEPERPRRRYRRRDLEPEQ